METFVHLLFPGQLDGTAGSSAGDGAFGPQHLRPVYCQRARLGLASQTFTYLLPVPRLSEQYLENIYCYKKKKLTLSLHLSQLAANSKWKIK